MLKGYYSLSVLHTPWTKCAIPRCLHAGPDLQVVGLLSNQYPENGHRLSWKFPAFGRLSELRMQVQKWQKKVWIKGRIDCGVRD
jgi:hypothetical protein